MSASANIARHLPLMADRQPDQPAVKIPRGRTRDGRIDYLTLTFRELDAEVDAWVARLQDRGVGAGDRVLVMVRQGLPLIAAAFALFKLGAVPVIIDPGMGRKNFLACVARSQPRVLLGIPVAQLMSRLFRTAFKSVKVRVWASGSSIARLSAGGPASPPQPVAACAPTDLAAILFTSGSTGAPKGVCYEHGMFEAQVRLVRDTYGIQPGEVDLPMLPIFALFNPALGMTTIVPEIDPARPATVDPAKIVQAIRQEGVTSSFGSPTLWRIISRHCRARNETLPSLRRVLMAGAPVPPSLFADLAALLPNGTAHSPYGATEALPITSISAPEVLGAGMKPAPGIRNPPAGAPLGSWPLALGTSVATAAGHGTCVGRPVADMQIKIIPLADGPVVTLADTRELPAGEIGEIIVAGPVVTKTYDQLPAATALAKIAGGKDQVPSGKDQDRAVARNPANSPLSLVTSAPSGAVWHRLGDLGYLDAAGRLWFCGRKAERVETPDGPLYTEQVEPIFLAHPAVARIALIGAGHDRRRPAIVVEPHSRETVATPSLRRKLVRELRELGSQHPHTDCIRLAYLHPRFPVDVRHNAKIHRLTLAAWAATQQGYEMDKRTVPLAALKR